MNLLDELELFSEDWDDICETLKDYDQIMTSIDGGSKDQLLSDDHSINRNPSTIISSTITPNQHLGSTDRDIMKYGKLIENGINSHCPVELKETLETFCTEDLVYLVHYPKGNSYSYSFRHVTGRSAVANYLYMNYSTTPDILFLIHQKELISDRNGHKSLKCKFTISGTGLFTVEFVNNGIQLPSHPYVEHTQNKIKCLQAIKKIKNKKQVYKHDQSSFEREDLYASQSNVTFKKSEHNPSKFNRYKAGDTLGAYVEYEAFSECNIKNNKKKFAEEYSSQENCDIDQSNASSSVIALTDAERVALYAAEVANRYTDSQKFYGNEHSTYIVSEMFPLPVPVNGKGIMTLHIDENNKVCMIENMISVKPL